MSVHKDTIFKTLQAVVNVFRLARLLILLIILQKYV
jgi:ABC-type methionine transport system permease subunit